MDYQLIIYVFKNKNTDTYTVLNLGWMVNIYTIKYMVNIFIKCQQFDSSINDAKYIFTKY